MKIPRKISRITPKLIAVLFVAVMLLTPAQALAATFINNWQNIPGPATNPNSPLGNYWRQNFTNNCDGYNDGQTFWISTQTNNAQQTITVLPNQDSVDLQINTFGFHCNNNLNTADGSIISKSLVTGRTNVPIGGLSAHLGGATGPLLPLGFTITSPNRYLDIDNSTSFNTSGPPDYRFIKAPGQGPFGYPATLPFTLDGLNAYRATLSPGAHSITITVLAEVRPVNQFDSPYPAINGPSRYVCAVNQWAAPGGLAGTSNPSNPSPLPDCPTYTRPLRFTLNLTSTSSPTITCDVNPGSAESGVFTPNAIVRNPGPTNLTGTMRISVDGEPGVVSASANIAANGGTQHFSGPTRNRVAGQYTARATLPGVPPATCNFTMYNKPYVRTFGGDSFAGVSDSCDGWQSSLMGSGTPSGGIYGFSNGTNQGSAAQLALASLYRIQGVKSGALSTSGLPNPPDGNPLHFANIGFPAATGVIGGHLGVSHCPANYQQAAADRTTGLTPRTTPIDAATGGVHRAADGYKLTDAAAVTGFNQRTLVYVEGNAIINSNIEYFEGPWASTDQIPSLMVVASGNIYIGSGVTRLDGIYIAQNSNPNQGVIYTCANDGAAFGSSALYGSCNRQLTINGALIANHVKFLRTFGSLRDSISGSNDYPGGVTAPCSNPSAPIASPGTCAAEVINFRPEVYLAHHILGASGTNGFKVDYIVSPPPLL